MALAVKVDSVNDLRRTYRKVCHLHLAADHIVAAYNLKNECGYQDDNEHGAGPKILTVLQDVTPVDTAVFMARVYGGKDLGSVRFDKFKMVTKEALQRLK